MQPSPEPGPERAPEPGQERGQEPGPERASDPGQDGTPEPDTEAGADAADMAEGEEGEEGADPLRFSSWMKRSATGAVLTGIALGLQHALEREREQPAFVMEAPGEPDDPDAPITLHFDPDDPGKTVAVVRARPPGGETGPTGRA